MFKLNKTDGRPARIRTRYLTPVLLTAVAANDDADAAPARRPLRGFLLELSGDRVTLVLGDEVARDARYVLRIAGEEGVSEEPACTVLACRRDDASHVVAQLRFDDYRLIRPAAATAA